MVLQSCDMEHKEHVNKCYSIDDLKKQYPLNKVDFADQKFFDYGGKTSFTRFMLIGEK